MKEEIKNWWKQAKDDLEKAEILLNNKKYDGAVFFCQQAVEKGLKAINLRDNKELIKTHDLAFLARKIKASDEILSICSNINPVYTDSRYVDFLETVPAEYYTKDKAEEYMKMAKKVIKWIKETLGV